LAALPQLQKVVDIGHWVQLLLLCLSLQLHVIISTGWIQFSIVTSQLSVIGWSELPYYGYFAKGLACDFSLPPRDHISPMGNTCLHSDTVRYDREYIAYRIGEIGVLCVRYVLLPGPVGDIW
jgi:hypothetical protein